MNKVLWIDNNIDIMTSDDKHLKVKTMIVVSSSYSRQATFFTSSIWWSISMSELIATSSIDWYFLAHFQILILVKFFTITINKTTLSVTNWCLSTIFSCLRTASLQWVFIRWVEIYTIYNRPKESIVNALIILSRSFKHCR